MKRETNTVDLMPVFGIIRTVRVGGPVWESLLYHGLPEVPSFTQDLWRGQFNPTLCRGKVLVSVDTKGKGES